METCLASKGIQHSPAKSRPVLAACERIAPKKALGFPKALSTGSVVLGEKLELHSAQSEGGRGSHTPREQHCLANTSQHIMVPALLSEAFPSDSWGFEGAELQFRYVKKK